MADHTDSFIREVDEQLKREQFAKIWARYGNYIMAAAVLLVLGVAGYKFMEQRRIAAAQAMSGRYEAATRLVNDNKPADAEKALESIAQDASGGYATLAKLRLAAGMAKAGKTAEAVAAYDALAKDGSADDLLRDFAALQSAMLRLEAADWTEMQNRLNDLINDRNAWHASARELLGLAAYKAGKMDEAHKTFEQLLGERGTPPSIVERTQLMLGVLTEAETLKGSVGSGTQPGAASATGQNGSPENSSARPDEKK